MPSSRMSRNGPVRRATPAGTPVDMEGDGSVMAPRIEIVGGMRRNLADEVAGDNAGNGRESAVNGCRKDRCRARREAERNATRPLRSARSAALVFPARPPKVRPNDDSRPGKELHDDASRRPHLHDGPGL